MTTLDVYNITSAQKVNQTLYEKLLEIIVDTDHGSIITRRIHRPRLYMYLTFVILWSVFTLTFVDMNYPTVIRGIINSVTAIYISIRITRRINWTHIRETINDNTQKIKQGISRLKVLFLTVVTVTIFVLIFITNIWLLNFPLHVFSGILIGWYLFFGRYYYLQREGRIEAIENFLSPFNKRFDDEFSVRNFRFTRKELRKARLTKADVTRLNWEFRNAELEYSKEIYGSRREWRKESRLSSYRDVLKGGTLKLPRGFHIDADHGLDLFETEVNDISGLTWNYDWNWNKHYLKFKEEIPLPHSIEYPTDYLHGENVRRFPIVATVENGQLETQYFIPGRIPNLGVFATAGFGKSYLARALIFHAVKVNIALLPITGKIYWHIWIIDPSKFGVDFAQFENLPGVHFARSIDEMEMVIGEVYGHLQQRKDIARKFVFGEEGLERLPLSTAQDKIFNHLGEHLIIHDEFTASFIKTNDKRRNKRIKAMEDNVQEMTATGRYIGIYYVALSQEISRASFSQWMKNNFSYRCVGFLSPGGSLIAMGTTEAARIDQTIAGRGYWGTFGRMKASQNLFVSDERLEELRTEAQQVQYTIRVERVDEQRRAVNDTYPDGLPTTINKELSLLIEDFDNVRPFNRKLDPEQIKKLTQDNSRRKRILDVLGDDDESSKS